jgi:hypothetical protein
VEGKAGVRFGLQPNLEIEVYDGLANASAGADGGMFAEVTVNQWEWIAETGLVLDLFTDGELTFWGLLDESARFTIPDLVREVLADASGPLVRLEVSPDPVSLQPGGTQQAQARAISLITGADIGITPPVNWGVGDNSVATISGSGLLTAQGYGETVYQAQLQGTRTNIVSQVADVLVQAPNGPLTIGTCVSTNGGASCASSNVLTPGQQFAVLFGADNQNSQAQCGTQIFLSDPFTGESFNYVIPIDAPTCLGAHWTQVPPGTPAGTYNFTVGPAILDGFSNGPQVQLPVVVY